MRFLSNLREVIKKGDFFNSYQMLRYQKETQYRTFTGGIISIGIIVTIFISFASMILGTINRTTINFTQNSQRNTDPTLSILTASPRNKFMFGVQVWGYNLSSHNRLFDVIFTQIESNYGQNYTYTNFPLEECTPEHWAMLPNVIDSFDRLKVGNWLCPEIGTIIKLQGKYTSDIYNQFSVTLYPCSNSTDPDRPCASSEDIDQFFVENGQWNYFTYYYVNSIVNPDQPQYIDYYLQDRTYIVFGPQLGAELDLYLNQIEIKTDNSIWPISDSTTESVFHIDFNPILFPFAVGNGTSFATFFIMKDPSQVTYQREVQKIFVIFSFMGGLIGAVMAGLFIMNSYTSFAYELALALDLFKQNQNSPTHRELKKGEKSTINLMHYVQYYAYIILKRVVVKLDWNFAKYVQECREEIQEQLDVKGLVKRIIFLEYAISYILEDFHITQMQLKRPTTPSEVKVLRQRIQAIKSKTELDQQQSAKNLALLFSQHDDVVQGNADPIDVESINIDRSTNKVKHTTIANMLQDQIRKEMGLKDSGHRIANEFIKKKTILKHHRASQIQKLLDSAKEGNIISKKLLKVNGLHKELESCSSQIQNASLSQFFKNKTLTKARSAEQ